MRKIWLGIGVACAFFASVAHAEEIRNPFLRKMVGVESAVAAPADAATEGALPAVDGQSAPAFLDSSDALLRYSVNDFAVTGTVTAPHDKVAALRAAKAGRTQFLIRIGDTVGIEHYIVRAIDLEGVSFAKEERILRIPVHNPAIEDIYDANASASPKRR